MMQIHKVKAQLHMLIGTMPISIQYESDAGAEAQWQIITGMLAKKKPGDFVVFHHDGGTVWVDLGVIGAITWTKEQRITAPMTGLASPGPGMRMS